MLGEIVHNEHVIEALRPEGLRIVQTLDAVPAGGVVILQSHGSTRRRYDEPRAASNSSTPHAPWSRSSTTGSGRSKPRAARPSSSGRSDTRRCGASSARSPGPRHQVPDEVTPRALRRGQPRRVVAQSTFIEEQARQIVERIPRPSFPTSSSTTRSASRRRPASARSRPTPGRPIASSSSGPSTAPIPPPLQYRPGPSIPRPTSSTGRRASRTSPSLRTLRCLRRVGRLDAHGAHRRGGAAPGVPRASSPGRTGRHDLR